MRTKSRPREREKCHRHRHGPSSGSCGTKGIWEGDGGVLGESVKMGLRQHSQIKHTRIFLLPLGKLFSSIISLYSFKKALKKILHPLLEVGTLGAVEKHIKALAVGPGHRGMCHAVQASLGIRSWETSLLGGCAQSRSQDGTGMGTGVCDHKTTSSLCSLQIELLLQRLKVASVY